MGIVSKELVILSPSSAGEAVIGGGERYLLDLIPYLLEHGWRVTLVCAEDSSLLHLADWPKSLNIETMSFPVLGESPWKMLKTIKRFSTLVRRNPQAVFFGNTYLSLKWLAWAKIIADVPTAAYLQESFCEPYYSLRARFFSRLIDQVVAISKAVRTEFIAGASRPAGRISCIPHGILMLEPDKSRGSRQAFWQQHDVAGDSRIICMVGRTDPLKGHEILAEAFVRLAERMSDVILVVVGLQNASPGEKQIYDRFMAKVEQAALASKVRVFPNLPNAREFMRHSDLLVVPSISEGLGRVAIEGQAERTCLVASAVGGLKEIVTDDVTGSLVPPGDAETLLQAFIRLLEDDALRERLATSGRDSVQERFSVQSMNKAFEQVFLELLEAR